MNWYNSLKYATLSLYHPKRVNPNISPKGLRFYNYIKSHNVLVTLFHGTAEVFWQAAQKKGYLIAPSVDDRADNELRYVPQGSKTPKEIDVEMGRDQIFLTAFHQYALSYATRTGEDHNSNGVVLKLAVPLYAITEVRNAVLAPDKYTYNEFLLHESIVKTIQRDGSDEEKVKKIIMLLTTSLGQYSKMNEVTVALAIPVQWVKGVETIQIVKQPQQPQWAMPNFGNENGGMNAPVSPALTPPSDSQDDFDFSVPVMSI